MGYGTLRFEVAGGAAEAWSDALLTAGALSVEVTDPAAGTPDETAVYDEPGESASWPRARITALFAADADAEAALVHAASALQETPPVHALGEVPEADW